MRKASSKKVASADAEKVELSNQFFQREHNPKTEQPLALSTFANLKRTDTSSLIYMREDRGRDPSRSCGYRCRSP